VRAGTIHVLIDRIDYPVVGPANARKCAFCRTTTLVSLSDVCPPRTTLREVRRVTAHSTMSKVPAVTLGFWIIKIAATTLGETGGDLVTMSMNLGYLVGTGIFAVIFLVAVSAQIRAKQFHPFLYWTTIIATTTVGTTLAGCSPSYSVSLFTSRKRLARECTVQFHSSDIL